jgi:hypothetical protein
MADDAQGLTPYRYEFKCDSNRVWNYILSMPRFEPESLGWITHAQANFATVFVSVFLIVFHFKWYRLFRPQIQEALCDKKCKVTI